MSGHHTVNDVTQLNPVRVMAIVAPLHVEDVQEALRRTNGPVSIGGGRFSMGGQTACPASLHFDMRTLNRIVFFSPAEKVIRVQEGVRWCDIQRFVDPHGLSVKIMQTYANFTVGGSLSVNCHGRYVGLGPMVMSVGAIRVVLHDGNVVEATRTQRPELFFGVIGGYGALGIEVEIELDLAENKRLQRVDQVMPLCPAHQVRDTLHQRGTETRHRGRAGPDAVSKHFFSRIQHARHGWRRGRCNHPPL